MSGQRQSRRRLTPNAHSFDQREEQMKKKVPLTKYEEEKNLQQHKCYIHTLLLSIDWMFLFAVWR